MNEIQSIKEAIRIIAKNPASYSVVCNVSDIDLGKSICNCTPVDGSAILVNVRLNADYKDGFKLIPKDGSLVVVSLLNNTTGFISMVSEVDEIHLNGTNYGGVVKVIELTDKLNALENDINTLKTAFSSWLVVPNDGGAALKTISATWAGSQLTPTQQTEIENQTILQGNGS
jgi:hypothetical protein